MDDHRLAAFNSILGWLEAEEQAAHDRMNQARFAVGVLRALRDQEEKRDQVAEKTGSASGIQGFLSRIKGG